MTLFFCHSDLQVLLEEKLNSLQSGYDVLIKKEVFDVSSADFNT
jgi:hypothetical protein